ncbi:MAG TPA: hypothetical protein VF586_11955 [Pyrinomonadaceae bacterium]|jgi:hypothetical protein
MAEGSGESGAALVFVYNADGGVFNTLADAAHKIFSPRTYACNLCALTHGAVRMRGEWKQFLEGLGRPLEFLHADELASRYGLKGVGLPAIFTKGGGGLKLLAGADSVNACRTLGELEGLVLERLAGGNV